MDHHSTKTTKTLLIGESGTGKSGALASLAAAGYRVHVLDLDNGMDVLKDLLHPQTGKYGPEAYKNLDYITLTEKLKVVAGKAVPATASVWTRMVGLLEKWEDKDSGTNLGPVASWTEEDVLVVDTGTAAGKAAYNYILSLNGKLLTGVSGYEYQRVLGQAQQLVEDLVMMLCAKEFKCNLIFSTHINYVDEPGSVRTSQEDNIPQVGTPNIIGRVIGTRLPRHFNNVLMTKKVGTSQKILTKTPLNVNLKAAAPTKLKAEYPLENGLAEIFKVLREG